MSSDFCDISKLIRFKALSKDIPRNFAPGRGLYPSGQFIKVGGEGYGKCPRSVYYDHKFPERKKVSYRLQCMANMGNLIEEMLITYVKEIGAFVASQVQMVDTEAYWSGKVDIIVNEFDFKDFTNRSDIVIDYTKHIPIEIKSVYGYMGKSGVIISNSKQKSAPKPNAVLQLALYLDYLQRMGFNSPYGVIWYMGRDEGDSMAHKLTIEKRVVGGSEKRFIRINGELYHNFTIEALVEQNLHTATCIDNNIVPPREYTLQYNIKDLERMAQNNELSKVDRELVLNKRFAEKGDIECNYCDYSEHCYKDIGRSEEEVKQKLHLDVDKALWRMI